MLTKGSKAPAFSAPSTLGTVHLQESLGKKRIVLIFYPKDNTPVCTKQLCAARDSRKQYESAGAEVYGVNPGSLEDHQAFADKHGYDFPLISDTDGRIRQLYDVGKIFGLFGQQRLVYAIEKDGTIVFAQKGNPSTSDILAAFQTTPA
ncbi:peroxiredoxin [Paenibacillus sp. y28]|uniref:peroxiredoxin n=1 Tax=Paenibacillus sp. y28 TaxID=3129110 RepID=UPI0030193651